MAKFFTVSVVALLMLAFFVPAASARPFRGVFFGPAFYGPAWYGPAWVSPYDFPRLPVTGSVKFETNLKDPLVYVDGGLAGNLGHLKTFQLRPGTHHIELRDRDGRAFFQQQINVIVGKTIKLTP